MLAADQLTKYWAESTLSDGHTVSVLGDLLQLRLLYNPGPPLGRLRVHLDLRGVRGGGGGRGDGRGAPGRVAGLGGGVGLVLGGATTHLLDRLFREPGFARGTWWTSSTTPDSSWATSPTSRWWSGWASSCCSTCAAFPYGQRPPGRDAQ
ncbi:hypothetical protein NKG94_04960 [Micromonospora sp. M12]